MVLAGSRPAIAGIVIASTAKGAIVGYLTIACQPPAAVTLLLRALEEIFELAEPGKEFEVYSRARLARVK